MLNIFRNITFENPGWFWLLAAIPLLVLWYIFMRRKQTPSVKISGLKGFKIKQGLLPKLKPVLFVFQMLGLVLLIAAMARPRSVETSVKTEAKDGIDIMMAVDVSGSMLARDLKPDRLQALKEVATKFVEERPNDRLGLVIYAGESYTKVPVTSDRKIVMDAIRELEYDSGIQDGTAIGMGLATAVNRLKDSKAKSRVVILLTDGVNNMGQIDPYTAVGLALRYNIKVYTIGIGTNGMAPFPVQIIAPGRYRYELLPVEIDEELLKEIAKETGGVYFRATDKEKLQAIYDEINQLETSEVEETIYHSYDEKYKSLLILGGAFFLLEFLLRYTVFRSFV